MMVYVILIAVMLVGVVCFDICRYPVGRSWWIVVAWLSLVLVAGLRYRVGGDTFNYIRWWDEVNALPDMTESDWLLWGYMPLWNLFGVLCKTLSDSFLVYQLIHALILNTIVVWFFLKHTPRLFTALLLYTLFFYLYMNTEVMRASFCVAMFMLGYDALCGKRWLNYFLCCVVAVGMHPEAFVMLFFPLCLLTKRDSAWAYVVVIALAAVLFMSSDLIDAIVQLLSFNQSLSQRVSDYGDLRMHLNLSGLIRQTIGVSLLVAMLYLGRSKTTCMRFFMLFGLLIELLSFHYVTLFSRLNVFVNPILILWMIMLLEPDAHVLAFERISHTLDTAKQTLLRQRIRIDNIIKIAVLSAQCCLLSMFYFTRLADERFYKLFVPYSSYLTQTDYPERLILYDQVQESEL